VVPKHLRREQIVSKATLVDDKTVIMHQMVASEASVTRLLKMMKEAL